MTKRLIQEDVLGEFGFRLLWSVEDHWADVKAYKIVAVSDKPGFEYYVNGTREICFNPEVFGYENLETYLEGYIKWDGCCELNQGQPHWCGPHDFGYHILLLEHIYKRAHELMNREPEDEWQLDIAVKDEFKEWYD